jgi:hypothetical protein
MDVCFYIEATHPEFDSDFRRSSAGFWEFLNGDVWEPAQNAKHLEELFQNYLHARNIDISSLIPPKSVS